MTTLALQVACMQFINIVVHSVEDMNFRVHLQYEFTKLGLDEYLDVSIAFFSPLLPSKCAVKHDFCMPLRFVLGLDPSEL